MKKWIALLMVMMLVLSMAACGDTKPTEEPKEAEKTESKGEEPAKAPEVEKKEEMAKIGVTIYKFDDNFMSFVRRSIEKAAGDKAELILNDSQNNQAMQNDQVDMMISKGVKALAINLVDPQAAPTIIGKAKAEDMPVIFFNKEPDAAAMKTYDKAWYVGTNSAESGVIQGEMMAKMWNDNPEWDRNGDGVMSYVLLKGEPGHPDAEARTKYSIETVVEKGIKVKELELQTGMWDSVKGKELMDAWIAKHGEGIEMVVCNNDAMALGAIQSLNANGYFKDDKYMPVVGVDAIPDALEQIKAGFLAGTVLNDAKNQGQATFDLANNAAQGKDPLEGTEWKFDENKAVRVPYVAITIDNIDFAEKAYE